MIDKKQVIVYMKYIQLRNSLYEIYTIAARQLNSVMV